MYQFNIYYLRFFTTVLAILSFFNIIYSYYFNLYLNVDSYFYTLLIALLPALSFFFKSNEITKVSIYYKIQTVILGYFILPLVISLPYYLSIYNISFIDAYFEAISGFTSTGFTVFENLKHLNQSLILWRSSTQWIGGLYFLISLILLIDIFDTNLKKTLTNFISFSSSETLKQSFKISFIYLILTIIIFFFLSLTGIRIFDSFNLSLTLISSGGFLPDNNLNLIIEDKFQQLVLSISMLLSFFSLFLLYNLVFFKVFMNRL